MTQGLLLLNRYEILGPLGSGGSSDVVRAFDRRMEREVAIKRLPNNPHTAPRALREAQTLALLNHPGIVSVYDFVRDKDESFFYLVMEILEGKNLSDVLPGRPLPLQTALSAAIQISSALEFAHTNDIIHRDIKPANIMLLRNGRIKILDFGIARLKRSGQLTADGQIVGTIGYLAPEQAEAGVIDERTDLFLFAILLYRMLTGVEPFAADTAGAIIYKILNIDPVHPSELNPEIPEQLGDAIMRALEKYPEDRYDNVTEFRYKLERFVVAADGPENLTRELYEGRTEAAGAPSRKTTRGMSLRGSGGNEGLLGRISNGLWGGGLGRADAPVSALLAFIIIFSFLVKAIGFSPWPIVAGIVAAGFTFVKPRLGIAAVLASLVIAAGATYWWLILIAIPVAVAYLLAWKREEGYAPLLPFTAPLLANVGATSGFGLGLLYPFVAGYTLAPLQAAVSAVIGGFFLEGYDLLYKSELRFLGVPGPHLAGGADASSIAATAGSSEITGFLIQITSPFATNPFLLLQPFLLGLVAFVIASFRVRQNRVQALVAATGILFLLFGFSFFLTFSPDQGPAFQNLIKQILAIIPAIAIILAGRRVFAMIKGRFSSRALNEEYDESSV